MSFDAAARALRDVSFAETGVPVMVDPDGDASPITVILSSASERGDGFGRPVIRHPRELRVKAENLPQLAAGTVVALLDSDGAEIERRVVQGEPEWADSRRLTAILDTAPA